MDRLRSATERLARAWGRLAGEQRLAVMAALVLLLTLFLPWYQTSVAQGSRFISHTLNGFGSADFVMASVVLVAFGVLGMQLARGEGRGFHLPGGDGLVTMVAGGWVALLIFYRVIDHPNVSGPGATIGVQWGVFVAFLAAALLVYAGYRIRGAHRPEPPLPLEDPTVPRPRDPAGGPPPRPRRRRPVAPRAPDDGPAPGQMSFDEAETQRLRDR